MSADNWAMCPKCLKMARERKEEQKRKAEESYGKVSAGVYGALLADSRIDIELDETLREDYCLLTDQTGRFTIEYRAHCDRCGFKHTFNHSEQLET